MVQLFPSLGQLKICLFQFLTSFNQLAVSLFGFLSRLRKILLGGPFLSNLQFLIHVLHRRFERIDFAVPFIDLGIQRIKQAVFFADHFLTKRRKLGLGSLIVLLSFGDLVILGLQLRVQIIHRRFQVFQFLFKLSHGFRMHGFVFGFLV